MPRYSDVVISGLAHIDAAERVTTAALEDRLTPHMGRLGIIPGAFVALSGIEARRFLPRGQRPSDIAAAAGRAALADAGLSPGDIGALINTSVGRDYIEPSTACLVHAALGLAPHAVNFDVSNACLGFLSGMEWVASLIALGRIEHGLVVDGEDAREVVEATLEQLSRPESDHEKLRESLATLTLGSGGAAMVLSHRRHRPDAPRYTGSVTRAATEHNGLCRGQRTWMRTDGIGLLTAGVDLADLTFAQAREELGWRPESLDLAVLHQVSALHTKALSERLGLPLSRIPVLYREYGNVGPASIPILLSQSKAAGRLTPGTRVGLLGIGSGLNCAMAEVMW